MESNTIAVSIIMPVYNSEKYLKSCVDSILSQDFDSYELLLIDDGSTDGSPEICDDVARRDARVRVFHKENGGICEARNYGLQRANGEYIAFSDHDDIVLPGFLSENYRIAKENKADIVKFGRKGLLIRDEKLLSSDVRQFRDEILSNTQVQERFLELRISGAMNCVWDGFFRKAFLDGKRIEFDTRYKKGGEDIDFCSRCFVNAERIVLRSKVYYEHYIRIGISTSTIEDPDRMKKFEFLGDNLAECIPEGGLDSVEHQGQYNVLVARDEVYPSVKYLLKIKKPSREIKETVRLIYHKRGIKQVAVCYLKEASPKWWMFTLLFMKEQYSALIRFMSIYLLIKKVGDFS